MIKSCVLLNFLKLLQPFIQDFTLSQRNLKNNNMAKTLRVIDPFFIMEVGDTFDFDPETNMYVSHHKEEFYKMDDRDSNEIKSSYSSEFQISPEYANNLVEDGYLENADEDNNSKKSTFVNIFDEIDNLLSKYKRDLDNINEDTMNLPICVKVERETVLNNLCTLLEHLKSLKK